MRRCYNDRLVRRGAGAVEPAFDPRGGIDEDIVEARRKAVQHQPHRLRRERALVRFSRREQEKVCAVLQRQQRLPRAAAPFD